MGEVAVSSFSSFSAFHGGSSRPPRAVAQSPPTHIVAKQNDSLYTNISSMDAIAAGEVPPKDEVETEDGLFAVKLSPRSPEMTKSPFSFSANDTAPWMKSWKVTNSKWSMMSATSYVELGVWADWLSHQRAILHRHSLYSYTLRQWIKFIHFSKSRFFTFGEWMRCSSLSSRG